MSAPPPTRDSVLTVAGAVRALPMRDADARRWLIESGLVVDLMGRDRVIWGRVLDELSRTAPARAPAFRRPSARCATVVGGEDSSAMGAKWPRPIVMGSVRAAPMKGRGRRDGRAYWRVRRTLGGAQVALSIVAYTATGSAWATRAEAEAAILSALADEQRAAAIQAACPGVTATPTLADPGLTVGELLSAYVDHREAMGGLSASTLKTYRGVAKRLGESIGQARVADMTTASIQDYARNRLKKRSAASVRLELAVLAPALQWALDADRVPGMTMPKVELPTYTPTKKSTPPTLRALRKAMKALEQKKPIVYRALRLAALLGARGGEIWALRWWDVSLTGSPSASLRGKTGEREVPLSPAAVALLEEMRAAAGGPAPEAKVAGVIAEKTIANFRSHLYRAIRSLPWEEWGEEPLRPHQLRALFSDRLIKSGVSLPVFQALTGHSAAVAAKHYWEARPEEKRAAVLAANIVGELDVSVVALRPNQEQDQEQGGITP